MLKICATSTSPDLMVCVALAPLQYCLGEEDILGEYATAPKSNQTKSLVIERAPLQNVLYYDNTLIQNRIVQMSSTDTAAFNILDDYYCYSNFG
jgi:hypothetical protein